MIILVTGGASGLGEAITRRLAESPENLIYFTYCNSEDNVAAIKKKHSNVIPIRCDFEIESDVLKLCGIIQEIELDVLINNAYVGNFMDKHFIKTPISEFSTGFTLNIVPTLTITQAALKKFRLKKAGKIITILSASLLGKPPIGTAVYTANKAYLKQMMELWAVENTKYNIKFYSVWPQLMLTNLTNKLDERIIDQIKESLPGKKLLMVSQAAEALNSLLNISDDAELKKIESDFRIRIS